MRARPRARKLRNNIAHARGISYEWTRLDGGRQGTAGRRMSDGAGHMRQPIQSHATRHHQGDMPPCRTANPERQDR